MEKRVDKPLFKSILCLILLFVFIIVFTEFVNAACRNQCNYEGDFCSGNYALTCKDTNLDGCLEKVTNIRCQYGCSNGQCTNPSVIPRTTIQEKCSQNCILNKDSSYYLKKFFVPVETKLKISFNRTCNQYEFCCRINDNFVCNANPVQRNDFFICNGIGLYKNIRVWCKPGVEKCSAVQGFPVCTDKKEAVGNPSYTNSFSAYLIRDKNDFYINGKLFVISPSTSFKEKVRVTLNYSYYPGKNLETYKYVNHESVLNSCQSSLIKSVSKEIDVNGGEIALDNKIDLEIPPNALDGKLEINIAEYDVSNCYIPGQSEIVSEFPRQPNMFFYYLIGAIFLSLIFIAFLFYWVFTKM